MTPFLLELAQQLVKQYKAFDQLTVVFPNRRAILYFRKYLGSLLSKPAFSPQLLTIEDFIGSYSNLLVPDKLELVYRLYSVYHTVLSSDNQTPGNETEPFDQFYFWGEMLLRDFDEVDRYMIKAEQLFKDLSFQKELDSSFDFLTAEQRKFLEDFWGSFASDTSLNKKRFLTVWRRLPEVYHTYRQHLRDNGLAYEGMLHREVAGRFSSPEGVLADGTFIHFAGFNALTRAEETIIAALVDKALATVHWDIDEYYVNNNVQEAGTFFRSYQQHPVLGKTFSKDVPANFLKSKTAYGNSNARPNIKIHGASQSVGQAKLMAQVLQEMLQQGADPEETLVVLSDEKLMIPVLHGIAGGVKKLNVTMGFPLSSTPVFNLIELLVELQIHAKDKHFNHRQVLPVLGHPYVVAAEAGAAASKSKEILHHNWVYIPDRFLATHHELHRLIFSEIAFAGQPVSTAIIDYLRKIVVTIGTLDSTGDVDKEYAFSFFRLLNRMEEVVSFQGAHNHAADERDDKSGKKYLKSFLRLFRQLVRSQKIPFHGEPLRGLQVMGVLETRNLDFRNVFILSLNEGIFPGFNSKGSYIPFNIRKAYNLPTADHQDAIYAYLFYRLLQRAENIHLFYNSETDVLGQGEMSRYLQQLIHEGIASGLVIEKSILHNPLHPRPAGPIVVNKDERVFNQLARFCKGSGEVRYLSPSTLNDYIDCRLKFYLRHVERIREAKEVEEELDARILGNFLHKVMELFYRQLIQAKGSRTVTSDDFSGYEKKVSSLIDQVFISAYRLNPDNPVDYEGQRLIVKEVVNRFVDEIIQKDREYAPFEMKALESGDLVYTINVDAHGNPAVTLGGSVDRADLKNGLIRVVDYKTGKDKLEFESIAALFRRDGKRNKAAFQTMTYALLYYKSHLVTAQGNDHVKLLPGLFNRVNLFDEDFRFGLRIGRDYVDDAISLLPEFEQHIKLLLEELYDPAIPFDQTDNPEVCRICAYRNICYR